MLLAEFAELQIVPELDVERLDGKSFRVALLFQAKGLNRDRRALLN